MRRITAVVLILVLASCTSTATISTRSLGTLEARINGGDAEHLFITTEGGFVQALPRAQIKDIDHPGNPLVVVGGILAGTGALDLAIMARACGSDVSVCLPLGAMTAAGVTMLVWGLWTWLGSRFAVDPPASAQPAPAPLLDQPPPPPPPSFLEPAMPPPPPATPGTPLPTDAPAL